MKRAVRAGLIAVSLAGAAHGQPRDTSPGDFVARARNATARFKDI